MTWRLFRILSAQRGQLGRELAQGYILESLAAAKAHADSRLRGLAVRALDTRTGEYCDRLDGATWGEQQPPQLMSKAGAAPAPASDKAEAPARYWWQDIGGGE